MPRFYDGWFHLTSRMAAIDGGLEPIDLEIGTWIVAGWSGTLLPFLFLVGSGRLVNRL